MEFEVFNKIKVYLLNEDTWIGFGVITLKILFILLLSVVVIKVGRRLIERVLTVKYKSPIRYTERRQNTLIKLLQNILSYTVYFSAILAILALFEINIAGLLAGAGIVGLAIGFGAQSLVKDIITGFFIVFEDQFAVGDEVLIGTARGNVEEIGLRTTKVKSYTGELFIIPNGSIMNVVNYSVFNSRILVDIKVAYGSNIQEAEEVIKEFLKNLPLKHSVLVKDPEILGVEDLTATEMVFRIVVETLPNEGHDIARKIRRDLKEYLQLKGKDSTYPIVVNEANKDE